MAAIVANCAISLNCELTQPVKVQYIDGNMFSMDNAGNTAHVYVFYNGEPQEIVGSVSADVIRSDGTTVAITGAMSGNRAYVIFPQSCYAVPGVVSVVIKVTEGSTVTTIAAFVANVYRSSTDTIVDPGTIIPSVQNLISAIETAVASIPADYSSLWESLAPDYTNITFPVTAGKYCTYNGTLYIAKVDIATTESFTAAHWQSTNIGDNLSALKGALSDTTGNPSIPITGNGAYISFASSTGGIDNPVSSSSAKYIVAPCSEGDQFVVSTVGGSSAKAYGFFKSDKITVISSSAADLTCVNELVTAPANSAYFVANAVSNNNLRVIKNELLVDKVSKLNTAMSYVWDFKSNDAINIPAESDLNDYTTPGNYKVTTVAIAASIVNTPVTTRGYRLLVMQNTSNDKIIQIAIANDEPYIYYRTKSGTWQSWKRIADSTDVTSIENTFTSTFQFSSNNATAIQSNDDLNDYTTPGNYKAISNAIAASLSHCPVSSAFAMKVLNISTLSNYAQIIVPNAPSTGNVFYRLSATGDWRKVTDDRNTIVHENVILTSSNYSSYWPTGSFNEAQPNTIYGINEDVEGTFKNGPRGNSVTGQPQNQSVPDSPPATAGKLRGTVITYSQAASQSNQSGLVQLYIGYRETTYSPIFAYRIATYSNDVYTWSNWAKFEENGYLHAGNEIIFGGQPYIQNAPFTDLNDAPGNSIYHADKNMDGRDADHTLAHHPTPGYSSIIITYSFSYTTPHCRMQMVCSLDGRMYWRYGYLQASDDYRWTAWNRVAIDDGSFMQNKGILANGTDLNTIADNSIYLLGGQTGAQYMHNALADGAGYLTTKVANGIVLQVCEALSGARYSRYSEDSGSTWSNWV